MSFRKEFVFSGAKNSLSWFIGHMNKGLRDVRLFLKKTDCVIEVHDARIPFSGRNPLLNSLDCPRVLVLNKCDLIPPSRRSMIMRELAKQNRADRRCFFINSLECHAKDTKKVIRGAIEAAVEAKRELPSGVSRTGLIQRRLLVVGIPNVGKSAFINAMRRASLNKGNCVRMGNEPGVTRALGQDIVVERNSGGDTRVIDSPGIMPASMETIEDALRVAAIGSFRDSLVGEQVVADYQLYTLNRMQMFGYVDEFKLEIPTDSVQELLRAVARRHNMLLPGGVPDRKRAAIAFIRWFRKQRCFIDSDRLNAYLRARNQPREGEPGE